MRLTWSSFLWFLLAIFLVSLTVVGISTSVGGQSTHSLLPPNARGPVIPRNKGYLVEKVGNNLYRVADGAYDAMFLVYDKGVVAVDAPPTIGKNYLNAISEVTKNPVTHVIYSHAHTDHIGAASLFPKTATYIAQEETTVILSRMKDPRRPIPTVSFAEDYTLKVGNQVLELHYAGVNHQAGNIFIYAPQQKVLMLVDIVYPGWIPFKNLGIVEDVPGYLVAHDVALQYDFNVFIGGHVNRYGTRKDVEESREFALDLKNAAQKALQAVNIGAIAQKTGVENVWYFYDTYQDTVVDQCVKEMLPKWRNRLGGVEVYLADNCWVMQESLSVQFPPQ
ncbi:MAG: MBL fold metallo-hydrolase [Leptolyngbyaceae cyanobacterium bins.302]|nr:MBL fold metallo-hydrolase [Leptolyngbyaceae cyanobacterium bins.302]